MHKSLQPVLDIQELDMQMIRLMRLKRERQKELANIESIKKDLQRKVLIKESEIIELKKNIRLDEGEVLEVVEKIKKLESQQGAIRKVDEFNALSQEISTLERERSAKEQRLGELTDAQSAEEDMLKSLQESLTTTTKSSRELEDEINESIERINDEGQALKVQRDELAEKINPEIFPIYERLLRNKKSRVVVPIENRSCSGCHIVLTAQDENLVRKGERLVFCEHCSRVLYWPEETETEGGGRPVRQRRRRTSAKAKT